MPVDFWKRVREIEKNPNNPFPTLAMCPGKETCINRKKIDMFC